MEASLDEEPLFIITRPGTRDNLPGTIIELYYINPDYSGYVKPNEQIRELFRRGRITIIPMDASKMKNPENYFLNIN